MSPSLISVSVIARPASSEIFLPPGDAHRLQGLDQQRVVEALHLHKVDDVFHAHEQFASLQVLVGLVGGLWQERCRRWDWRQLVEVA